MNAAELAVLLLVTSVVIAYAIGLIEGLFVGYITGRAVRWQDARKTKASSPKQEKK